MFVVTGGGRGIGQAIARALAAREQDVVILGRDLSALQQTAESSSLIQTVQADLSTPEGRDTALKALQHYDHLKGLVHNAGTIEPMLPLSDITEADWQQIMALNVNAPLFMTQALLPQLEQGRVLNIGSGAAYFPIFAWGPYCVSKAALSMLTRCWQMESETIAFASIMPGICDTAMHHKILSSEHMLKGQRDFIQGVRDKGAVVTPETVALFVTWLLLDLPADEYQSQEWDIYDTEHHDAWLVPPHKVIPLE